LDRLPAAAVSKVALDRMLVEVSQLGPAACYPTQNTIDHVEATPDAKTREPFFDETSRVKLARQAVRGNRS
jgi:hypothetical protein